MENKDLNQYRYVGWKGTSQNNPCYGAIFNQKNIRIMSRKITEFLQGVDERNRDIIVPDKNILYVLSSVYNTHRPTVGGIHSRFIIGCESERNDVQKIIDRSIEIIVSQVRSDLLTEQNNKKLTIWNSLLGNFNKEGLRQHAPIKIRKRHPTYMQFHMRY